MPKYRVLEKSFIGNSLVDEGAVVDYDGAPGRNLEPIDAPAQEAAAQAATTMFKGVNVNDLTRQRVAAIGGSPDAVETARVASAASAAADAALSGATLLVDGKLVDTMAPAPKPDAVDLV